jgi:hypothetical protein
MSEPRKIKKPSAHLVRRFLDGQYRNAFHKSVALSNDADAVLRMARVLGDPTKRKLRSVAGRIQTAATLMGQVEEDLRELHKKYPNL